MYSSEELELGERDNKTKNRDTSIVPGHNNFLYYSSLYHTKTVASLDVVCQIITIICSQMNYEIMI